MIPVLTTGRLTLRAPRVDDFEAAAAFLASDRTRYIGGPRSRLEAWRALACTLGHWELRGYGMWGVEVTATGTFVGQVGLHNPEGWIGREIAWWIAAPELEGRGYAFEAAVAAHGYAFGAAGWREAFSVIHPDNRRSIRLAERLGAVLDHADIVPENEPVLVYRHRPEARP